MVATTSSIREPETNKNYLPPATSIVHFGDYVHDKICGGLVRAKENAKKSDVMICLGSTMGIPPANTLPKLADHIIVCNLQDVDGNFDELAAATGVRAYSTCDSFLELVHYYLVTDRGATGGTHPDTAITASNAV